MAIGRVLAYRFSDDAKTSIGTINLAGVDDVDFEVHSGGPSCATFPVARAAHVKVALQELLHQNMTDGVLDTKKELTNSQYITLDEDTLTITLTGGSYPSTFNYDACEGLILGLGVMFGV